MPFDVGQVYVTPLRVVVPEIEAVPPTSRLVLVASPELIPNLVLPVNSKLPEREALIAPRLLRPVMF